MTLKSKIDEEPVHSNGSENKEYKIKIVWRNGIQFTFLQSGNAVWFIFNVYIGQLENFFFWFGGRWRTVNYRRVLQVLGHVIF
ncbi:unnamed protein product [Larinioides sclopetarius]|uniref:Uncharacterized protein n=1 Tax=Larinioides sclopetarius TaxID=280406 RepID=A0AAV2B3B9_9ARAC